MAENHQNDSPNLGHEINNPEPDTKKVVVETPTEKNKRKMSETENLEAIRKFIEEQEREIYEAESSNKTLKTVGSVSVALEPPKNTEEKNDGDKHKKDSPDKACQEETMAVATSVMDMILSESEAKINKNSADTIDSKPNIGNVEKGNTMALTVGSKVEAKDFKEFWHFAEIAEVDYDEMEVLVHYNDSAKKHDEWISVSSPRLRPRGSRPPIPVPEPVSIKTEPSSSPVTTISTVKEEPREKSKSTFEVGERCLARWRDNRRFIATVSADLGDGKYEIIFDDGVRWTCNIIRLSKLKDEINDPLSVDTSGLPSSSSTPSPVYASGPSNVSSSSNTATPTGTAALPFNTHLFDPTRDYLSSKSERREMKRKLNIKEIFNIGQKKKKVETPKKIVPAPKQKAPTPKVVKEVKPKVVKKQNESEPIPKKEIPDAVASIIGTAPKSLPADIKEENIKEEVKSEDDQVIEVKNEVEDREAVTNDNNSDIVNDILSAPEPQTHDLKQEENLLITETKVEKLEQKDGPKHDQAIDRIKEAIVKLEGGLNQIETKTEQIEPKCELKVEVEVESNKGIESQDKPAVGEIKEKKNLSKVKKISKVKLKREKKVKKQVEKVKSELEEMKKQVEEMRKQMAEELAKKQTEMPESFLLPGEWCCKWVNGTPVGKVSELEREVKADGTEKGALPRRSVQVEDKRLPPGWTKHMLRRSLGSSAGKWDVVLMSPDNHRFHTRADMKGFLESRKDPSLKQYESALMDFGIHLKLSRRMGWYTTTPGAEENVFTLPAGTLSTTSPLIKQRHLSLKRKAMKEKKKKKLKMKLKVPSTYRYENYLPSEQEYLPGTSDQTFEGVPPVDMPLEDGYVYVGSLKVQILENLLRCPAEGCFKNFRNNTLLKMHIKHYHRELRKMLGATPKVLDLAYARTRPTAMEMKKLKFEAQHKKIRVKLSRPYKRASQPKPDVKGIPGDINVEAQPNSLKVEEMKLLKIPRSQQSPKMRNLLGKPVKRPKVLLPVRKPEVFETVVSGGEDMKEEDINVDGEVDIEHEVEVPMMEPLDFEAEISTHTVTKPSDYRRKDRKKIFASISKASEDEEWYGVNSDVETRSSYPRSGSPDSKMDQKLISSESNEEQKEQNYMYTETGERIKIVHMKREEIINCHCGFREEDGLMVQCELCLCWQHALCHNIQKESEVPEKYTCSICLNPRRGRRSQRFLHDQDRLYEGLLPGAKPCESIRRSHELSGNLHRIEDALQALRVKYYVATKKDHPKLYLWAKDWEMGELAMTQEKLNSDYSDLSIMISNIGKENLPVKPEDMKDIQLDIGTPPSADEPDADRFSQKDNQLGSQALLSGLLSSPGGASLDLPITTIDIEKLAKSVQAEQEAQSVIIPQPEAAIENSACRERLLRHIQRCQALIDARLDSVEAQVAELESQDPSFEDDETADFFPRTKQTIQMLMRDLDTMEELGVIT